MPKLNGVKYKYDDKGRAAYKAALQKLKKKRKKKLNGEYGDNYSELGLGVE